MKNYIKVAQLSDFDKNNTLLVKGQTCPVLIIRHDELFFAIDNRCPHMGFPLHKGTIQNGLLTCHWHHARFDVSSGCTFNLFADDIPSYDVQEINGDLWISNSPKTVHDEQYHAKRLVAGVANRVFIAIVKSIIGLLESPKGLKKILSLLTKYAVENRRDWPSGLTFLTIAGNLENYLSSQTKIEVLSAAAQMISDECSGQAKPIRKLPLKGNRFPFDQLFEWMNHWAITRQSDAAERTLMTAISKEFSTKLLNQITLGPIQNRIYADTGHSFDFANKAFELINLLGNDFNTIVLPSISNLMIQVQGEEDSGAWRAPIDLIPLIRKEEESLKSFYTDNTINSNNQEIEVDLFLEEDPIAILKAITSSLKNGIDPASIAQVLCYAASQRLVQFPESNELGDWFSPIHTFIYSNALYQALNRSNSYFIVRGLYALSMSIYNDRYLNIPSAKKPQPDASLNDSEEELLEQMEQLLDQKSQLSSVPKLIVQYLYQNHDENKLIDKMVHWVAREDLDFHLLQVLEAAIQQAQLWSELEMKSSFYVGAMRYLSAHCPTSRNRNKMTLIGIRLQKGENLHT